MSPAYDHPVGPPTSPEQLRRRRLASQRLTPETWVGSPAEAARAVLGIQAQDVRAAGLAIRSRVPGVTREQIDAAPLVRTWTARGTVHLLAADDLPWIDALTGPRNRRRFDALMVKRENLEIAQQIRPAAIEILADGPMTRAALLERLDERGLPSLGPYSVNILMPWLASTGEVTGLANGTFRASEPPPILEQDEALSILAHRYLEGYGPAGPEDLARWSGLPITAARRALEAIDGGLEHAGGDLLALPGMLDREPPPPPPVQLLAAFDTSMLGWRNREPLLAARHDERLGAAGGMIKAVVLSSGRVVGTWRLDGSGRRRGVHVDWFGSRPPVGALSEEIADVGRYLDVELHLAS